MPVAPEKPCELCFVVAPLQHSHVIPAFVFKWLRESSPGKLRTIAEPNRRVQDGPKEYWLCVACEQRFAEWERTFAEQVFRYVHVTSEGQKPVRYSDWALKFAVSISWRTLRFYRDIGLGHLSKDDLERAKIADQVWREFLLGNRQHPAEFEQHILLVDALAGATGQLSPWINRYLLRSVQSDILSSNSSCITHTKLGRIIVIGFIRAPLTRQWRGTKIHANSGTIGGDTKVPGSMAKYWNEKADQYASALASISTKQAQKIDDMFASTDPDVLANSEAFRAMRADVHFSGDAAFASTDRPKSK